MSNPPDKSPLTTPHAEGPVADQPDATRTAHRSATLEVPATTEGERYELHEAIARGGMGEVYSAHDRVLGRRVAIKVLRANLVQHTVASRFVEEARITGQLQHPGVPPVHDLGTLPDGRPFMAMKLIRGLTLADLIAREKLDPSRLVMIFERICQTVGFAHSKGVIHRDLKPANVMVGDFGEVQVMDWGLAKVLGEAGAAGAETDGPHDTAALTGIDSNRATGAETQAGSVMGTPSFMPPEQAIGAIDQIDARSDVFGLGGILCAMLTGEPPFVAAGAEATRQLSARGKLDDCFARLAKSGADPELVALCRGCLAAEKGDRPTDAGAVAAVLAAFRAGAEDRARRAELDKIRAEGDLRAAAVKAAEERKRRRVQLALVASGVLLLLGGGAAAWWQDKQATERRAEQERATQERDRLEERRLADLARIEAERRADALRQQVAEEKRAQADRDRLSRNSQAIESLLGQCEEALRAHDAELAALPLAQIDKRLGEGGADDLKPRTDQCRADLAMLRALDRADEVLWNAEDYKLKAQRANQALAKAFAEYGIVLGKTQPADAARIVTTSQLRERLLRALDLWHIHPAPGRRPPALRKIIDAADPDPFRIEVRDAIASSDKGWSQALLSDPAAVRQPAWFAAAWAQAYYFPAAGREKVLRTALERAPSDFTLLLTMCTIYESIAEFTAERANQQLRWAQAAVSVRPQSKVGWRMLGRAQWDKVQIDEAVRCYRRACQLDPNDYNSWTQLGAVLLRKRDPEAALEALQKALALNPNYSHAHDGLGAVFDRMGRYVEALECYDRAVELNAQNNSEYARPLNSRGYAQLRLGKLDAAINDFREALRISPDDRQAETNLKYALDLRDNPPAPEPAPPPRPKRP